MMTIPPSDHDGTGPALPTTQLVLVVDDNTSTAALVSLQLRHHGIDTCCAPDGAAALAAARERRPDLVLLDANLPDMDGMEVCRQIKSDPRLTSTLVAFLSAERTSTRYRVEGLNVGADAYFTHPIEEAELVAQVRSLLRLRHAELAARDSRDLYRDLLDAAPIGIAHVALDGIVVTANRALASILVAEPAELAGRLFDVFLHPDERTLMRVAFGEVATGSREGRIRELRLLTSTGSTAWARIATRLHRAPDGSPSHVIVAVEDVTARRSAEAAVRERDHLLHELHEVSHDLIATVCSSGRILEANSALHRALGMAPGTLRDTPLEAFLAPTFRMAWHAALARVSGGAGDELFRGSLVGRNQTAVHIEGSLARRDSAAGPAVRVILHDVSERRRLEEQALRNQRLDSIGTLAGGIAHDLNNVLAPVLLSLGLIRSAPSKAECEEYITSIEHSVRRASDLVRQVLLFAHGGGTEKSLVEPATALRDLTRMLHETFPKHIEISSDCSSDAGPIHANPTQLNQVLLNLCLNARDAMPDGGRLSVRVHQGEISEAQAFSHPGATVGPAVIFTVGDTGPGIAPEIRERMFDPFFTTKEVGKGTGLGLPTALGIVRSHGGLVSHHSAPDEGTTFSVVLPCAHPVHAMSPTAPAASPTRATGELILLIDDERILRQAAESVLRAHGYRVITAIDGVEGIARASAFRSEVRAVVTDLMMPRLDGFATAEAIRRLVPGIPVIAMTGYAGSELAGRIRAAGIDRLISKPFEPEDLLRVLDEMLHRRPADQRDAREADSALSPA